MIKERRLDLVESAIDYAQRFIGLPYHWGGNDAVEGFDCSGLAIEMLQSVGIIKNAFDATASGLAEMYPKADEPDAGVLAFYGKSDTEITHVAICLGRNRVLEAGGGNSKVIDNEAAKKYNAFIRIRPIDYRRDLRFFRDPFIS
jgi:cell wall-associated NlpC family hydrolase